jgi:hypothetical protein
MNCAMPPLVLASVWKPTFEIASSGSADWLFDGVLSLALREIRIDLRLVHKSEQLALESHSLNLG